jgi:membrane protease YdiL (CAAX protease family)
MTSVPSLSHPLHPELPDGVSPPPSPRRGHDARLGVPGWAPFAVFLAAIVATQILGSIVVVGFGVEPDDDVANMALTFAFDLMLVGFAIALVWRRNGFVTPAQFALRPAPWLKSIAWIVGSFIAIAIANGIIVTLFGKPPDQDVVTDLKSEDSVLLLAGFGFTTCVLAPLAEEFFFRGFLFRSLAERMHLAWAALIAGGIFGLVHWPGGSLEGVAVLGTLGVLLCLMVYYTASLLPGIIMHASFNSLAFGSTKELPWWGYLLVLAGSVATTLAISLMATRLGRRAAPGLAPA